MCVQLLPWNVKLVMEGVLKEIVKDGGGHMVQVDETLEGLSHFGLGQGLEILAAL